jgi:hypothetical protein
VAELVTSLLGQAWRTVEDVDRRNEMRLCLKSFLSALLLASLMNTADFPTRRAEASVRAARGINVHRVLGNARYRNPTGEGILVSVTDDWIVDDEHEELAGRVIVMHDPSGIDTSEFVPGNFAHATAMAGNIAAAGVVRPEARGSAPEATILSLLSRYQPSSEVAYAARTLGLRISHNAWGPDHDEVFAPPRRFTATSAARGQRKARFGYYGSFNKALDKMIRSSDVLSIWANGNEAYLVPFYPVENGFGLPFVVDEWHRANAGYDTAALPSNSKNVLAIGATMHDDIIASFSSRGPTYDGRLSPHLVAPGFELQALAPGNNYGSGTGTSGSSAIAAGAAALIQQQYREIHGADPGSAIFKAILINSSRDLGPKGPDYVYGFGMMDAEYAAQTVGGEKGVREYKKVLSEFIESTITNGETRIHTFRIKKKVKELRATLVWHDPPKKKLVNDLELAVRIENDEEIRPLTLDPEWPQRPATMKRNSRDTAEHIVVKNPAVGDWEIRVEGRKVRKGPQPYALVIAAGKGNRKSVRKNAGDFTIDRSFSSKGDVEQPETVFSAGDDIYFHTLINVHSNADYGDYYGTVTSRYELRDEEGELRFVITGSWDNCAPSTDGQLCDVQTRSQDIPDYPELKGTYRVRSIITMHNGVTGTAPDDYQVTIE